MAKSKVKNQIKNHIVFVLDESSSMEGAPARELVKVAEDQIAYLARRSGDLKQETRVTVYTFADNAECIVSDVDVLRLPSVTEFYRPYGNTALIDAVMLSLEDLALTPTKYGNHSFLIFVLTDGQENRSYHTQYELHKKIVSLPENYTVAVLVPDQTGVFEAKRFGFPANNIAIWDATTAKGVAEVGEKIRQVTDNYMVARSSGTFSGTKSLFSMGADALNQQTVKAAKLKELPFKEFLLLDVNIVAPIRKWVESQGYIYQIGKAFYQLTKPEIIQPQKEIALRNKKNGKVYTGAAARSLLGLPSHDTKVNPEHNPEFDVFVQSTSVNRNLMPGTKLLLLS